MLTEITITGTFKRPDGTPAKGIITATLTETIENGTEIIEPDSVKGVLGENGELVTPASEPFKLYANDDTDTKPIVSQYTFLIQLDHAPNRSFKATVPHAASEGKIDISELDPS